jgi:hypothetical protein
VLDALTPIVCAELRKPADWFMRNERPRATLHRTATIHKAYPQIAEHELRAFQSRAHFPDVAARIMGQVLIGNAGRYREQARAGGNRVEMQAGIPIPTRSAEELLEVDEAWLRRTPSSKPTGRAAWPN